MRKIRTSIWPANRTRQWKVEVLDSWLGVASHSSYSWQSLGNNEWWYQSWSKTKSSSSYHIVWNSRHWLMILQGSEEFSLWGRCSLGSGISGTNLDHVYKSSGQSWHVHLYQTFLRSISKIRAACEDYKKSSFPCYSSFLIRWRECVSPHPE